MKIFYRLISLRFNIMALPEKQEYCPIGVFYLPERAPAISSIVINLDSELPGLPIVLGNLELVFPNQAVNEGSDLMAIDISSLYKPSGDFRLGSVQEIEIPDGTPKIDKYLFMQFIACQDRFKPPPGSKHKLYRRVLDKYLSDQCPIKVIVI